MRAHFEIPEHLILGRAHIKILMVVDGPIRTAEKPGAFGIGRVKRLIEALSRGCTSFETHTARRHPFDSRLATSPGQQEEAEENGGHISTSFRFDDRRNGNLVIDDYDEIWLFGFNGESDPRALDTNELRELTRWMNAGGGLFATGDHATLGAALCSGIPRVREMRRWTNADGVPPAGTRDRIDTNRPTNQAEAQGDSPISFAHERDATPQEIRLTSTLVLNDGMVIGTTPHPILCHPQLGAIDVMPDHPHEGRTRTPAEMTLDRSFDFGDGVAGDDFPQVGANRPGLSAIAFGETEPSPPTDKPYKGRARLIEFPMVTVYDGESAGVGRVVVDSTWHHWFDLNIQGLEASNPDAWGKVSRYFENIAVWLARRYSATGCFLEKWTHYPFIEEFDFRGLDLSKPTPGLGQATRRSLQNSLGPCDTTFVVNEIFCQSMPEACVVFEPFVPQPVPEDPKGPLPPVCLTCPPPQLIEEAVLEAAMRAGIGYYDALVDRREQLKVMTAEDGQKLFDSCLRAEMKRSIGELGRQVRASLEEDTKRWSQATAGL